ncbi:MAG: GAF domain-containing protein [Pseudomonadota bacterium]
MAGWLIDDEARLRTLREFGILDTDSEIAFDGIVAAAAAACDTPVALVTMLDRDRQWFKAHMGTDIAETSIDNAICVHTLAHGGPLAIDDLSTDPRTATNPLVTDDPRVRFYAGVPLVSRGQAIGTLCVLDVAPRPGGLDQSQWRALDALAQDVMKLVEAR